MTKEEYKEIRDLAWSILIETNINKLPVDIIKVCEKLNIKIRSYDNNHKLAKIYKNGFSLITSCGEKSIYYNKSINNINRCRFTIAHELGHIMLNHNKKTNKSYKELEKEANMFAIRILSPICILHEINISSPDELSNVCKISNSASYFRYKKMKKARVKNLFYYSEKEKIILHQFRDFINQYNNK